MVDVSNYFPKCFHVVRELMKDRPFVELNLYKVGERVRWEGWYRGQRISLYFTGWHWIVEVYWYGKVNGYFRSLEQNITTVEVSKLVEAACFLIDTQFNDFKG